VLAGRSVFPYIGGKYDLLKALEEKFSIAGRPEENASRS